MAENPAIAADHEVVAARAVPGVGVGVGVGVEQPRTGDDELDELLVELAHATTLEPQEQVAAFDAVHRALHDRLADDEG